MLDRTLDLMDNHAQAILELQGQRLELARALNVVAEAVGQLQTWRNEHAQAINAHAKSLQDLAGAVNLAGQMLVELRAPEARGEVLTERVITRLMELGDKLAEQHAAVNARPAATYTVAVRDAKTDKMRGSVTVPLPLDEALNAALVEARLSQKTEGA